MNRRALTEKQFRALESLAVLSPLLRLLPGLAAARAGALAWASALAAFPLLLGFAWLLRRALGSADAAQAILDGFGNRAGRLALGLLTVWFWLYGGILLRSGAERFLTAMSVFRAWQPYALLLLAIALPAALGEAKALFRAAEIFSPILTAVLLFSLAAVLGQMDWRALTRAEGVRAGMLLTGTVPVWEIGCGILFYTAFFRHGAAPRAQTTRWLLRLCLTAAAICAAAVGTLGPAVTARLSHPFFVLLRNLSLSAAVERFEALIAGLWVLPDFAMLALLLQLGRRTGSLALQKGRSTWVWLGAGAAALTAQFAAPTTFALQRWSEQILPLATLTLTLGLTAALWVCKRAKK